MTDKKLDTGTGGFTLGNNRTPDTKVYTYDVGIERDVVDDGNWSGLNPGVDKLPRDLSAATKKTLAQYLSDTTLGITDSVPTQAVGAGNRYNVPPPIGIDVKTTTDQGTPAGPQYFNYENSFEPLLGHGGELPTQQSQNSRPSLPRPQWFTEKRISRGMIRNKVTNADSGVPDQIDGNDLLRVPVKATTSDVTAAGIIVNNLSEAFTKIDDDHPVAAYSTSLIKNRWTSNNRFSPLDRGGRPTRDDMQYRPLAAIKYKSGVSYTPEQYIQGSEVTTITQEQLAGVGNTLLARASTELTATDSDFDPANAGFQTAASLLPGFGQLGLARVSELVLQAKDVLNNMDLTQKDGDEPSPGIDAANYTSIGPGIDTALSFDSPLNSFGSLNNPFDPFTGFGAIGMQVISIALVIAVAAIPGLIGSQLGDFKTSPGPGESTVDEYGRLPMGRYRQLKKATQTLSVSNVIEQIATGQFSISDLLGFRPTIYPLTKCITIGTLVFFGLFNGKVTDNDTSEIDAGQAVLKALTLSGTEAYVVICRSIFRSFLKIVDELIKVGRSFANPTAGVQQLLSFVDFFRNSKVMRALDTFAQLGDQMFLDDSRHLDKKALGFGAGMKKSGVDALSISSDSAYRKSRLISLASPLTEPDNKNLRHAWSSFRSPDMLILPKTLLLSSLVGEKLDSTKIIPDIEDDEGVGTRNGPGSSFSTDVQSFTRAGRDPAGRGLFKGVYHITEEGIRIPENFRKAFEKRLDAEYMPFYFHDVRTNEIISFHAFLTGLSDGYTASYDSAEAFGRVESIKTYKGTNRKISVDFLIASLSPEDFDYMWLKINKLTTLVYPQFTTGKTSSSDNFSITVPMSQQISASPLIRLRIGDLVQSNYSRFNLSRLFGYTYEKDKVVGGQNPFDGSKTYTEVKSQEVEDIIKNALTTPGTVFLSSGKLNFPPVKDKEGPKESVGLPHLNLRLKLINTGVKNVTQTPNLFEKSGGTYALCEVIIDPDLKEAAKRDQLELLFGSEAKPHNRYIGARCLVQPSALRLSDASIKQIFNTKLPSISGMNVVSEYQNGVELFMNPLDNAVVKSFESSGGRGLPGFIDSMNFDWYSSTVWEEEIGKRAPKICKVTISFSPFHDITPGLDHKGSNRAPLYPLGPHRPNFKF